MSDSPLQNHAPLFSAGSYRSYRDLLARYLGPQSRRVIWKKQSRDSESSDTLMRRSPSAARSGAMSASR